MPDVRIETRQGWIGDRKIAILDAVHAAMVEAIKIPSDDRSLRLVEHAPECFVIPPARSEKYTLVEITLFAGRSLDAKRALYKAIVRSLERLGVPPLDVKITLIEVPVENWGIRGGHAGCDIDLGFDVRV